MTRAAPLGLLLLASLTACEAAPRVQAEPTPPTETAPTAAAPRQTAGALTESFAGKSFGERITAENEVALASIAAEPAKFTDQVVKTTGVVQAVCQKAGCWMEIGDAEKRAHIKMAGHAFLVPKSASGHRAIVQGTVKGGEPTNACGSGDSCGGHANGALAKLEIVATGVEFLD